MVNLNDLFKSLEQTGVDFFTGVPDSLLNDFCLYLTHNKSKTEHVMAANEGNAIGIATGHYLSTGHIPVVYMQNSGIGNAMNPLLSLTHSCVYSIPMILVIGWRGDPSTKDHAQHKKQGDLTPVLMKDMEIPYEILDDDNTVINKFLWALSKTKEISSPVALIAKKGILTKKEKSQYYPPSRLMSREEAISAVIDVLGEKAIYLATTGRTTRELHEQLLLHGISQGNEFLNVGAMGHLSSIGLGMALGSPNKQIIVFDGDASAVMHMGSLATNGRYQPQNLIHIVLNNGVNESVGGQESCGSTMNLTKVAEGCNYFTPFPFVEKKKDLQSLIRQLSKKNNLAFIDVHVRQGIRDDLPKLHINHNDQKSNLMNYFKKQQ
jgi:phosphonopyruvate decarboxylase